MGFHLDLGPIGDAITYMQDAPERDLKKQKMQLELKRMAAFMALSPAEQAANNFSPDVWGENNEKKAEIAQEQAAFKQTNPWFGQQPSATPPSNTGNMSNEDKIKQAMLGAGNPALNIKPLPNYNPNSPVNVNPVVTNALKLLGGNQQTMTQQVAPIVKSALNAISGAGAQPTPTPTTPTPPQSPYTQEQNNEINSLYASGNIKGLNDYIEKISLQKQQNPNAFTEEENFFKTDPEGFNAFNKAKHPESDYQNQELGIQNKREDLQSKKEGLDERKADLQQKHQESTDKAMQERLDIESKKTDAEIKKIDAEIAKMGETKTTGGKTGTGTKPLALKEKTYLQMFKGIMGGYPIPMMNGKTQVTKGGFMGMGAKPQTYPKPQTREEAETFLQGKMGLDASNPEVSAVLDKYYDVSGNLKSTGVTGKKTQATPMGQTKKIQSVNDWFTNHPLQ
jgi:hypothetical protein